tara:strand:+ start:3074 stop:3241 length:168 start_codon:yes stop_codon:yes gene_type:complete
MAKTWDYRGTRKKGSFSQKKKELREIEDLATDGFLDEIANKGRLTKHLDYLEEDV